MARATARGLAGLAVVLALAASASATPLERQLRIGAYYYAWYGPHGSHWAGYLRERLETPQRPLLGEYDGRRADVIAKHYEWARAHGIDLFICSWWAPRSDDDVTIREHLLPSPAREGSRVALLYESLHRLRGANDQILIDGAAIDTLVADFDYLARTYFREPGYYRIDGKPVVVLYVSRIYRGRYVEAIRAVRAHVRDRYGLELYLVGDEVDWDGRPTPRRIRLFDAITAYTMYSRTQKPGWPERTGFLRSVAKKYDRFRRAAAAEGVAFVPGVLPGFNDRGYRPEVDHYALPHEVSRGRGGEYTLFRRFLALAGRRVDRRLGLMTITSWNEWHEDTQIEPTAPARPAARPRDRTGGYTYYSYEFRLLELVARFKAAYEAASAAS